MNPFAFLLAAAALSGLPKTYQGGALPEDDSDPRQPAPPPAQVTSEAVPAPDLPAHFDWRASMPPVDAQGECGSCTSFATVAALEGQLAIACRTQASLPLSRQYNFSCGGGSCRSGWKLSEAVAFAADNGVPDEPCLPYQSTDGNDVACSTACVDSDQRAVRGVAFERPTMGFVDVTEIKRALLKGPLVSSLILFEDLKLYTGGVYRHRSGNQLGSHAVVLVGWDDADRAWIARNSWGPEFGDGGYFEIAWDDESLPGRYTWLFDVSRAVAAGACLRAP